MPVVLDLSKAREARGGQNEGADLSAVHAIVRAIDKKPAPSPKVLAIVGVAVLLMLSLIGYAMFGGGGEAPKLQGTTVDQTTAEGKALPPGADRPGDSDQTDGRAPGAPPPPTATKPADGGD